MALWTQRLSARLSRTVRRVTNPYAWRSRVDTAIEILAPKRAFMREQARQALAMTHRDGAFAAGSKTLNNTSWIGDSGSIDEQLLDKLPEIRHRVRELETNDPHVAAVKLAYAEGVVGTGIAPKPTPDREALREAGIGDEEIEAFVRQVDSIWNEWVPHADATGRLNFYQLQAQAEQRKVTDGEIFVKLSMLSKAKYPERPSELAIEMIVADRVDTPINLKQSRERTRAGIQLEADTGRPVRVWVRLQHPGDRKYGSHGPVKWRGVRVRDSDGRRGILHLYDQQHPGQTRGFPLITPVLPLFSVFSDALRAELLAIKTQACFSGFITKNDQTGFMSSIDKDQRRTDVGHVSKRIEPATMTVLGPGEDVTFGNPTRPGNTFEPFIFRMLKTLGAGTGLSYETVSRDWTKTTYTSGRMAEIAQRRTYECRRAANVSAFYDPVRDFLLEEAWLSGRLRARNFRKLKAAWLSCTWQPKLGYIWVDPLKDAKAIREEIDLGLNSRRMECVARGRDPDAILRDLKIDEDAEQEILGHTREPETLAPEEPVAELEEDEDQEVVQAPAEEQEVALS